MLTKALTLNMVIFVALHHVIAFGANSDEDSSEEEIEELRSPIHKRSKTTALAAQAAQEPLIALLHTLAQKSTQPKDKDYQFECLKVFDYANKDSLEKKFVGSIAPEADFFVKVVTDKTLYAKMKQQIEQEIHPLLIYGPKGVGKNQLAHTLAHASNATLYQADFSKTNSAKDTLDLIIDIFKDLKRADLDHNDTNILLLKGITSELPFTEIFMYENLKEVFKSVFIIATTDIDLHDHDQLCDIKKSEAIFKVQVDHPNEDHKKVILQQMLQYKGLSATALEVDSICQELTKFNGHDVRKLLEKAAFKALMDNKNFSYQYLKEAKKNQQLSSKAHLSMYL